MVNKGHISFPDYNGKLENDKIAFFKKIKTKDVDTVSIIYEDTAPDIVKQAALFLNKSKQSGFRMALEGLYLVSHKSVISKEYIKDGKDWVLYVELTTKEKQGLEYTLIGDSDFRFAIGQLNGVNYVAFEGAKKVFVIQDKFSASFGYINMEELSNYITSLPDKDMYQLDNMDHEAYLLDAPAQLFAHDNVFYRDGDFIGMWISFGTLLKYDLQNLNNVNIDGVPVSIVDARLSTDKKFRKILENKAAGYASLIVDIDSMLTYLMKYSKQYILDKRKMDGTKICTDSVLYNLQEKGILGVTYEEIYSIKEMYIPAFDYTTASVKEIIDSAIVFVYGDEYIWMNYSEEDKEIRFITYKGQVHTFEGSNISVTVYNDIVLTRINKVNDDDFILFTGFSNLENNSVLDFYFDDTTEVMGKNSKFAIDVTAFDDFYKDKTASYNAVYRKDNELIKTYGNNKYAFETGLVHYEHTVIKRKKFAILAIETDFNFKSVVDAVSKKAYLNKPVMNNFGGVGFSKFSPNANTFAKYLSDMVYPENIETDPVTGEKKYFPIDALDYVVRLALYSNGWITFKDTNEDKYVSLFAERDIYTDFVFGSYIAEAKKTAKMLKAQKDQGMDVDIMKAARELYISFQIMFKTIVEFKANEMMQSISKKVRICSDKYRYEFYKKSDNIYVNNVPTSEVANHAVLFENTFMEKAQNLIEFREDVGFRSPYIKLATMSLDEEAVSMDIKEDLTGNDIAILFPDVGVTIKQSFETEGNEFMDIEYEVIFDNLGIRSIDGQDMHIYNIRYGSKNTIRQDKIAEAAKQIDEKYNISGLKTEKQAAEEEYKELKNKIYDPYLNPDVKGKKYTQSELENFFEFGVPALIAYAQGKILVSIDGSDWYEPYFTDNGLRLNTNIYVSNIDAFELILQNMSITDYTFQYYKGFQKEVDFVDLQQVKLEHISFDKEFANAYIEFKFKDVACVYNGILYQPGELVQTVVSIDKDYDKIVEVNIENADGDSVTELRRNVYVEPLISYKTIYPLDTKNKITEADEILNHENCFTVEHNIPIALTLDNDNYLYETKENALEDGAKMFFNFTKE